VPTEPASSANYWCTWYAQNYWQQRGGEITDFDAINNPNAREELTHNHLFNPDDLGSVKHIWAQDLLAEKAIDIYPDVKIDGSTLIIPGDLIDKIGTSAGDEGDISAPGMVVRVEF